jgi:hypothetical protein
LDWAGIFLEIITESLHIAVLIPAILVPLMVVLALLTDSHLLDRAVGLIQPLMQRLHLSKKAAFPLMAGFFLGIVFGSGVIIACANDGSLTRRDLILTLVFLGICHGIIEDTLIFVAIGANWWVLLGSRFFLAILVTVAVSFGLPSSSDTVNRG